MFLRLLYIFLSLNLCLSLWGQKQSYQNFQNIRLSPEVSKINYFIQDTQELIWIGSDRGLFSYDGYSTRQHFSFGESTSTGIYCGTIIDNTYLYLGTDNGLLIYNYKKDKYEQTDIQFPADIRSLTKKGDVLWLGSLNGLYTYNLKSKALKKYTRKDYKELPHETVYSIICAENNEIYIGTYNGLCKYIEKEDRFERINLPTNTQRSNQFINVLLKDTIRKCIWIGTEGNLYKYIPQTKEILRLDIFQNNSVKSLAIDANNDLLVGTDNGLYVYNKTEPTKHIIHDSRDPSSLSNNIIWNIFTDREKNVWLGTDSEISLSRFNNGFQYIPISQITKTGEGNHFYTLFKDSRNYFWFGGTNGLIRLREDSHSFQDIIWYKIGNNQYHIPHNRIRNIYEDKDYQLWIASDGGINRYNYATKQFIHYNITDSTRSYNCNWAYDIFEDNSGNLWIATYLGGIFVVNKQKLIESKTAGYIADYHYSTYNGLSALSVSRIVPDSKGEVWALYQNGVDKINIATREITNNVVSGIVKDKNLSCILCDSSGNMWCGFRGGIVRISHDNESKSIQLDKFSDGEVLSMTEVEDNIWVSTTEGVWVVNKQTMTSRHLNIMSNVFSDLFYDKDSNQVYMGSIDGFAITSSDILETSPKEHPIVLTNLLINNQPVISDDKISDNSIRYSQAISLSHRQNNLSFEFSDFPYSLEEKNKFVYKLEGLEKDWNLLKPNSNRITYNNLSYGKFHLVISKLDDKGNPSDNTYTLAINITPPWYYTTWAKILYLLLIVSLIAWTINFFRVKNRLKIERFEKERILEQSRSKIDFFTNISHDFKTPLSMIIAPVSKLLLEIKDKSEKKELEIVQRNAMKLNSLIHQVLDFNRVENDVNTLLILSKVELVSFSRGIFSIFEEEASKEKNLTLLFKSNKDKLYIDVDAIKMESILNNLLSNAFKYTPENGTVIFSLELNEESNSLNISVSDSGIGIPAQDIPYIFQRFFQSPKTSGKKEGTGIGLYLVKAYSELHGGHVNIISEENTGTTVTVTIPFLTQGSPDIKELANDELSANKDKKASILIVDDNAEIAGFIYQMLQSKYHCKIATDGKKGLELALELVPDLIIADFMMPEMNGMEMIQQIKKNIPTSTIPIILLTAKDDKETELQSIQLNIDAFISKPFQPEILLSRIEQLLKNKQQIETKARIEAIATPKEIEAVSYDEKFLLNITQIIEDHISDSNLNVNALSGLSGVNNKQIYRKVKQLTGMTPVDYIKTIRMKKAAMLLSQKKFTVAEVMYMVGYSNHSYFSKCFQTEFGKTPRQFMDEQ